MTGSAQHVCRAETTQIKELKYSKTKKKITRHPYSSFGEKKSPFRVALKEKVLVCLAD